MKEEALTLVKDVSDPGQTLNRLREYLQSFVLRSLHESEAFRPLAFVGGTALRFLNNLPRFSEEKLVIKLDIDTRPPSGARCERRAVTRHVTFLLQFYDLPSLLSEN